MGGGPKKKAKQAGVRQGEISTQLGDIATQQNALQMPFIKSRIEGGLPFLSQLLDFQGGTLARSAGPLRNQLNQRLSRFGSDLPSGFKEQSLIDFDSNLARTFDDQVVRALLLDEETRARAAGMLNPLGFFGGALQGNQSIFNSQAFNNQGFGSVIGGALGGLLGGQKQQQPAQ